MSVLYPPMTVTGPRLHLRHYYVVEAINAVAGILFLYCAFFWAQARFEFNETHNLLLSATHGLVYVVTTRLGGRLADRWGYDRILAGCTLGMGVTLGLGWLPEWWPTPFLVVAAYTVFIGPAWPALEAAIVHCPGQTPMPNRLGLYNITWALGDGIGFAVSGVLFTWQRDSIVWVPALLHGGQWLWLRLAPRQPVVSTARPPVAHRGDAVPRHLKQRFMHTAWLGNGLAFLMLAGFAALTPFVGRRLGLEPRQTIWLASALLFARAAAFVGFWKWEGWHYHRGWLRTGMWTGPVALAVAFCSRQPLVVIGALIAFGAANGLVYSASLYYSLDYGEQKGTVGGQHEAILGVGILIGPLLAALVAATGAGVVGAQWTIVALAAAATAGGRWLIDRRLPAPAPAGA